MGRILTFHLLEQVYGQHCGNPTMPFFTPASLSAKYLDHERVPKTNKSDSSSPDQPLPLG